MGAPAFRVFCGGWGLPIYRSGPLAFDNGPSTFGNRTIIDTRPLAFDTLHIDVRLGVIMNRALALGLILAVGSLLSAQTNDLSSDQGKLMALETAWNNAQIHRDTRALDSLVGDHYIYTDYDGTVMNKSQFITDIKDPSFEASSIVNSDIHVFMYPNVGIVTGRYHTKGTYKGKPIDHWGRFTDTWIFLDNKWQCIATHTNQIKKPE